ncbi:MAG: hypothetical protein KDD51_16485 [Bdellovibrionales bacterium]|nr:hypothetical protein [Bdellovibrionales bacterium]
MDRLLKATCILALWMAAPALAEFDPAQQLQQPEVSSNPYEQTYQQQQPQQQPQQAQAQVQQQASPAVPQRQQVFSEKDKNRVIQDPAVLLSLSEEERKKALEDGAFNFRDKDAYMDVEDAMHSKQFVHRHILSKTIAESKPLELGKYFINFVTTSSYVHQQGDGVNVKWIEYNAGGITLSGGFSTEGGHTFELGMSLSSISYVFGGYRYVFGTSEWDVWPYAGAGMGIGMTFLDIADGPFEVQAYNGSTTVFSGVLGMMVPLPDIAVKLEVKVDMWGGHRAVFTPGFGIMIFL